MRCFHQRRLAVSGMLAVLIGTAVSWCAPRAAQGVEVPGSTILVEKDGLTGGFGGVIANYTYDPANDTYYVGIFGSTQGLRKVWRENPGDPWQSDVYVENGSSSFPSDMLRFIRSSDVPGGVVDAGHSGSSTMGGMLLNPAELAVKVPAPANYPATGGDYGDIDGDGNISIAYAPGTLAFITDHGSEVKGDGGVRQFDWTKKVYRWDLRDVGSPTTTQPDYNTGQSGDPSNPNPGGLFGAYGQADWNDVFTVAMTEQQMRGAYTAYRAVNPAPGMPELPDTSVDNFGRQFAWSSDGQFLYAVDAGFSSNVSGIYKIDAANGGVTLLHADGSRALWSEPTVVATTTLDFGAGMGAGDQVVVNGSEYTFNEGGLSYVVDTGTPDVGLTAHRAKTLLYGDRLQTQLGSTGAGRVSYTTSDSEGNIYLWSNGPDALFRLDPEGRVSKLVSRAESLEIAFEHDGTRSNGGGFLRLQTREDETAGTTHVTFRGDNSFIGAVEIFSPADLNRDGDIDQADRDLFIAQRAVTQSGTLPAADDAAGADNSGYVNYLAADLSGDLDVDRDGVITRGSVDHMDELLFFQHVNQRPGDVSLTGTVTAADLAVVQGNLGMENASWFDGDFNRDGRVTQADVDMMLAVGTTYDIGDVEPTARYTGGATGSWAADVRKPSGIAADADSLITLARNGGATIAGPAGHTQAGYLTVGSANETYTGTTTLQLEANSQADIALGTVVTGKGVLDGSAGGALLRLGLPGYGGTLVVEDGGQLLGDFTLQGSLRLNTSTDKTVALTVEDLPRQGRTLYGDTPSWLVKTGVGALTLTGPSFYTGETRIEAGTLKAGTAGAIPAVSAVYVGPDAALDLNGYDVTLGGLSSSGSGTNPHIFLRDNTLTYDSSRNGFFRGDISGTGNLVKRGDFQDDEFEGILTLYEATTFTGATTVEGGTLALQHASNNNIAGSSIVRVGEGATLDVTKLAGGRFDVAAGQTLGGSGTVDGAVNVLQEAALAPGMSLGTLSITGDLTLSDGASWAWEFLEAGTAGDDYDAVSAPKLFLPQDGKVELALWGLEGYKLRPNDSFTLFDGDVFEHGADSPFESGANLNDYFNIVDHTGWGGTWDLTAGSLTLTAGPIPEPGTALMLLAGMAVAGGLFRRNRSRGTAHGDGPNCRRT